MATRRVRRIKRTGSKKRQSHHGRKTKRHHNRHNRITKKQRGGMLHHVFKKTHSGWPGRESNAVGIDIHYNDAANVFKFGSERVNSLADITNEKFNGFARYAPAVNALQVSGLINTPDLIAKLELTPEQFMQFADVYCRLVSTLPQNPINAGLNVQCVETLTPLVKDMNTAKTNFIMLRTAIKMHFGLGDSASVSAPSSAAAAADADEPNRGVILENVPGSGKMILHFGPESYDLMPGRPLKIRIRSPPSGNSPVKELIFLGNESGITVTFMMKKNETTYCALWTYDRRNQYMTDINYMDPSITKPLVLKSERRNNITDQIIPIIDQLAEASNGCDLVAARAYYAHSKVRDVDESIREKILAFFSLSGKMSDLSVGAN